MSEFLPCPFCGSSIVGALLEAQVRDPATNKLVLDTRAKLGVVGCALCGCSGPSLFDTADEMAERWNLRLDDKVKTPEAAWYAMIKFVDRKGLSAGDRGLLLSILQQAVQDALKQQEYK